MALDCKKNNDAQESKKDNAQQDYIPPQFSSADVKTRQEEQKNNRCNINISEKDQFQNSAHVQNPSRLTGSFNLEIFGATGPNSGIFRSYSNAALALDNMGKWHLTAGNLTQLSSSADQSFSRTVFGIKGPNGISLISEFLANPDSLLRDSDGELITSKGVGVRFNGKFPKQLDVIYAHTNSGDDKIRVVTFHPTAIKGGQITNFLTAEIGTNGTKLIYEFQAYTPPFDKLGIRHCKECQAFIGIFTSMRSDTAGFKANTPSVVVGFRIPILNK